MTGPCAAASPDTWPLPVSSLSEDHRAYKEEQFLPCCGFSIFEKNDGSGDVVVLGCPNGVDWDLVHSGDKVIITTDSGAETVVPFEEYREEVLAFADKVEAFYDGKSPRVPVEDDAAAYRAFWEEWHRRRREAWATHAGRRPSWHSG